jgi:hypothetical protein
MNERIRKIAIASGIDIRGHLTNNLFLDEKPSVADLQKFAESLVEACAQVCLSQYGPTNLNYKPRERFAEAVKQHFGVF